MENGNVHIFEQRLMENENVHMFWCFCFDLFQHFQHFSNLVIFECFMIFAVLRSKITKNRVFLETTEKYI